MNLRSGSRRFGQRVILDAIQPMKLGNWYRVTYSDGYARGMYWDTFKDFRPDDGQGFTVSQRRHENRRPKTVDVCQPLQNIEPSRARA
jgi:hypothetical protein